MSSSSIIKQIFKINDLNIDLVDDFEADELPTLIKKSVKYLLLHGVLSYKPKACAHCGVKHHGSKDIIKYGFKKMTVRLPHGPSMPTLLCLNKQRYFCKHCEQTFIAETPIVQKYSCISNLSQAQIAQELTETQSMRLIADRYNVSTPTVVRILRKSVAALTTSGHYLPKHIGLDEFKSVKDVTGKMSAVLVDTHNDRLIDIIEDRKQSSLIDYFSRFSKEAKASVETVTIDMYTPYLEVIKQCFPNAKIVIDRFHVVQLLNNTINIVRVQSMKGLQSSRPKDYRKLKNQWKLLLKNADKLNFTEFYSHRLYDGLVTEKMMADYLANLSLELQKTYDLMNDLKYEIETHDFKLLQETITNTKRVRLPKRARKTIQTLERFLPYIQNALTYTVSNGPTEGMNNKIKLIKRTGYGYSSFLNLRARILVQFKLKYKPSNTSPAKYDDTLAKAS